MKKVGILTFHSTNNYGAVLQAYALQKVIAELGNECEIIDYRCEKIMHPYSIAALKQKGFKRYLLGLIYALIRKPRNRRFKIFRDQMNLSAPVSKKNIKDIENNYDFFVVGSDQVWNGELIGYDSTYFLKFVEETRKKLTYSASFGFESVPNELSEKYKELIRDFFAYNLREDSGASIVRELIGKEGKHTLDPTLLLEREEWDKITKNEMTNKKYILVYQIYPSAKLTEVVKRIKKNSGYEIYAIPFVMGKCWSDKCFVNAGPNDWVSLFKNASLVVTDSFHGTAFSTIFNKVFYACVPNEEARITSYVKMLGLENRIVYDIDNLPPMSIDYKNANKILEAKRAECIDIISRMLGDEK